jgi:hypothetical protein
LYQKKSGNDRSEDRRRIAKMRRVIAAEGEPVKRPMKSVTEQAISARMHPQGILSDAEWTRHTQPRSSGNK